MDRVPCKNCGAEALPSTIEKTNGYCMPCFKGSSKKPIMQRVEDMAVRMGLMRDSDRIAHLNTLEIEGAGLLEHTELERDAVYELLHFGSTYKDVLAYKDGAEPYKLLSNLSAIVMYKEQDNGIESLTQEERIVYAIGGMLTEVNNGGFNQFFFNSSGELAYDLVPALHAVGSIRFKEIAEKAVEIFGSIPSLDEGSRYSHLEKITQNDELQLWDECDDDFYDCDEKIESMVIAYAETHLI